MASYRGHLAFASACGAVYGGIGANPIGLSVPTALLGGGFTVIGGLLPDLDSDSSVPVRELFCLLAAFVPLLMLHRLHHSSLAQEEILLFLSGVYLTIRYGLSRIFNRLTVHRGMFHSIPALGIAGMVVFLSYQSPDLRIRLFLAGGTALGYLSHLILDELYSVDFRGVRLKLRSSAGSAFKFTSSSFFATAFTYSLFGALLYLTLWELQETTALAELQPLWSWLKPS